MIESKCTLYLETLEGSHFWPNLEMLQNWLQYAHIYDKEYIINHLKVGLENSLKEGYDLRKEIKYFHDEL